MTVFKTFLKVLIKYKVPIILYTVILLFFGTINFQNSSKTMDFVSVKPSIVIINNDLDVGITKNLIDYISKNSEIKDFKDDKLADAIFYRDVNYVIEIPKDYRVNFLNHNNPEIKVQTTKDYNASLAELLLNRYLEVANIYLEANMSEDEIISHVNNVMSDELEITMTSELDTTSLTNATFFYNFMNYSLLAGAIYVICLVLGSFHQEKVKKRTIISSMDYKKHNRILLLSNTLFAYFLWLCYVIFSIILCGNIMFTIQGLFYIINSFIFTFCSVCLAFLISNLIENKDATNGIINVVALGSSFLTGVFVPASFLPDIVLKIAHILPSYWYVHTNELIKLDVINAETIKPIIFDMLIVISFSILFIIITNIVSRKKRKFA